MMSGGLLLHAHWGRGGACRPPHPTPRDVGNTLVLRKHVDTYLPNQALRSAAPGIRGGRRRVTAPVPCLAAAVRPVQGGAFVRGGKPVLLLRAGRALLFLEPLLVGDALHQLREIPAAPAFNG